MTISTESHTLADKIKALDSKDQAQEIMYLLSRLEIGIKNRAAKDAIYECLSLIVREAGAHD